MIKLLTTLRGPQRAMAKAQIRHLNIDFFQAGRCRRDGRAAPGSVVVLVVGLSGDAVAGNDVAEADGAERDEAEVASVEEAPPLPLAEEQRPAADVGHHHG